MTLPTVLVTGGAGYIGSHVCRALSQSGFRPIIYDDLSQGHRFLVKHGPLEVGDIRDRSRLDEVLGRSKPVGCIHLAGLIAVGESVAFPEQYADVNIGGTAILLSALREAGVLAVVMSSSCAVYGEPQTALLDEHHPLNPTSPYGRNKLAMEQLLQDCGQWGLRHVALRYFNAAGADAAGDIGEAHEPETHLIPLLLEVAAGKRDVFKIFGTDYPTPDGTAIRDFIHVTDLADAHVRAVKLLLDGHPGAPINLGSGKGVSVREMIAACAEVTGATLNVAEAERREGDPARLVAAGTRARDVLGWNPTHSELRTILQDAWRWHIEGEKYR